MMTLMEIFEATEQEIADERARIVAEEPYAAIDEFARRVREVEFAKVLAAALAAEIA